jgi:hypothetical protein
VADEVMLGIALREAVVPASPLDATDDIMLSIGVTEAVSPAAAIDVADDVMLSLGLVEAGLAAAVAPVAPVDVADPGFTDRVMTAVSINAAVRPSGAEAAVDLADAVMARIGEHVVSGAPLPGGIPRWASLGAPVLVFAMAAALLLAVFYPTNSIPTETLTAEAALPVLHLAQFNEAEVEDVTAADDATVQVMQFEEGAPTIIFVQEADG